MRSLTAADIERMKADIIAGKTARPALGVEVLLRAALPLPAARWECRERSSVRQNASQNN